MKDLLLSLQCLCLLFLPLSLFAQLPPNQPEQDCFGALPICQDVFVQTNSYVGAGRNPDEVGPNSCMLIGERNSVWYVFRVESSGDLCFTISPVDSTDDYDWAVYNLSNASCGAIETNPNLEVSCNWSFNQGCAGETGPNGRTDCPDQFEPCIPVQAGETYVINVSNFTSSNAGYTLTLSQSSAQLFDDVPPEVDNIESFCTGVRVNFSEQVQCGTVDPGDFSFSGPDGPYTISEVRSVQCEGGGAFDRTYDLIVSPPIQRAGNYTLSLGGPIADNCGNVVIPFTGNIFMPLPPTAAINSFPPMCEEVNRFGFAYTGPSQVRIYDWDFGDGNGSTLPAPIHRYNVFGSYEAQLIITDVNGCSDTAATPIEVLPRPEANFFLPATVCQGDTLRLTNLSTERGGEPITRYDWRLADGNRYNSPEVTHRFEVPGRILVFLDLYNGLGCRDTLSRFTTVYPQPEVDFLTEADVCFGDPAQLLFASTIRNDIANDYLDTWRWNLGDSTELGAVEAPLHTYAEPGEYPVTLWVTSDKGCTDSLTQIQPIYQPPPPEISGDTACIGTQTLVKAVPLEGGEVRWYETLGDATPFHQGASYKTPPVTGPQRYVLEVLSLRGCLSERLPITVDTYPVGEGSLLPADTLVEFPLPQVPFRLTGDWAGARYLWDFGDGQRSEEVAPVYAYLKAGLYPVQLSLVDTFGCDYRFGSTVEVRQLPRVFAPTAFTPNGDGSNDSWFVGVRDLAQVTVRIFNRQGQEVYVSEDPGFEWDGRGPKGQAAPEGVYVFYFEGQDYTGDRFRHSGTITLLR